MNFALSLWLFERTGSVTAFSQLLLFAVLPGILLSPFAGTLIDRLPRRRVMLVSELGTVAGAVALAALVADPQVASWKLYVGLAWTSSFATFIMPAWLASLVLLVPGERLQRANGLTQLADAGSRLVAPLLATVLLERFSIREVVALDIACHGLAVLTLIWSAVPDPPPALEKSERSFVAETREGLSLILQHPGLRRLLFYFMALSVVLESATLLVVPLIRGGAGPVAVGTIMTLGGVGMLVGGLVASLRRGEDRPTRDLLRATLVQGIFLMSAAARPSMVSIAVGVVGVMCLVPVTNSANQVIWQRLVPPGMQGRVFSVRRMLIWAISPVTYLGIGPLADRLFEPWMQPGGALSGTLGGLMGVGPGRGVALLMMGMGGIEVCIALTARRSRALRDCDRQMRPDPVAGEPTGNQRRGVSDGDR